VSILTTAVVAAARSGLLRHARQFVRLCVVLRVRPVVPIHARTADIKREQRGRPSQELHSGQDRGRYTASEAARAITPPAQADGCPEETRAEPVLSTRLPGTKRAPSEGTRGANHPMAAKASAPLPVLFPADRRSCPAQGPDRAAQLGNLVAAGRPPQSVRLDLPVTTRVRPCAVL